MENKTQQTEVEILAESFLIKRKKIRQFFQAPSKLRIIGSAYWDDKR